MCNGMFMCLLGSPGIPVGHPDTCGHFDYITSGQVRPISNGLSLRCVISWWLVCWSRTLFLTDPECPKTIRYILTFPLGASWGCCNSTTMNPLALPLNFRGPPWLKDVGRHGHCPVGPVRAFAFSTNISADTLTPQPLNRLFPSQVLWKSHGP